MLGKENGSILVVGGRQVGKNTLVESMIGPDSMKNMEPCEVEGYHVAPWSLSTKYYTATPHVFMEVPVEDAVSPMGSVTRASSEFGDNVEALLLVFDKSNASTFDELGVWESFISTYDPPVMLCVCNKADLDLADPSLPKKWQEWCLDHGVEYVEAVAQKGHDLSKHVDETGERIGVARVVDALLCNQWPNMQLKPNPHGPSGPLMAELPLSESVSSTQPLVYDDAAIDLHESGYAPLGDGEDISAMMRMFGLHDNPEGNDDDGFEQMLRMVVSMRNEGPGLPAEERRERAAEVALKLAGFMGLSDELDDTVVGK